MTILVTGGGGYVGTHVMKLLREQQEPCIAFDNFSTGHKAQLDTLGVPWIQGDITDAAQVGAAFAKCRPKRIIHLAALATLGACADRPADCDRINIDGTRNVLDAMRAHSIRDIAFASSCAVYANTEGRALDEGDALGSPNRYGQSKLAGEKLMTQYRREHGIRFIGFRIFNVAGAHPDGDIGERHDPETHLLPLALEAALGLRGGLSIFGNDYATPDGTAVRDYIHACDVASAFIAASAFLKDGGEPQFLNLGSGTPTSVLELLAAVGRILGKDVPAAMKPRREGDVAFLLADPARIRSVLGWSPAYSTMDTIVRTAWQWHRRT